MRKGSIPTKVDNVVLASPDIDVDVFRRQMIEMGAKRPHFTIFTSTSDKALEVSRWLSGGVNRVGGADPAPYADAIKQLGITVIDTSASNSNDALGHNAFADSPEIIALLGRRLSGQSLQSDPADLASRVQAIAAGSVNLAGSATRMATKLPMAAVSRPGINMLGEQPFGMQTRIIDGRISY